MTAPAQPPTLTPTHLTEWLSVPRFGRYAVVAGPPARAFALYDWNAQVAAAALRDLGHFEVALRNAYDAELSAIFPDWAVDEQTRLFARTGGTPADVQSQHELNDSSLSKLDVAYGGLGASPSHGQVVAALDFGFWASLNRRERTATFWTPMLFRAFPKGSSRGDVHARVDNLRKFRNRLAHNEPVFSKRTGLAERMRDLDTVFSWLRPEVAAWVGQRSAVPELVARCPVAGLVTL